MDNNSNVGKLPKSKVNCKNPKGFWQISFCESKHKTENIESTGTGSSGGFSAPLFGEFKKEETKEATGTASSGSYETPSAWAKSSSKKNWRGAAKPQIKGGKFVKIKDKCKTFPYCNQGDIKALKIYENSMIKDILSKLSERYDISENVIKSIIQEEIENSANKQPNNDIYNKKMNKGNIDNIINDVLKESVNERISMITDRVVQNINTNKKNKLRLTESELITMIENIVAEEKAAKEFQETTNALKQSDKINKESLKTTSNKMKEYLKTGSKGSYEPNPKHFPKGNGELAKMEKMAYKADKPTEEYIENFTAAGLENIVYDEIHPNEEWAENNIVGSSKTGNNPEWANAVKTDVNTKRNNMRKDNLLGAVKAMAYNKAPQPVTTQAKSGPADKFNKNFGKNSASKAVKILNQLESEDIKDNIINEEFEKINRFINYNAKTN